MDRRQFITRVSLSAAGIVLAPSLLVAQSAQKPEKPLPFPSELVRDFVGAGHNDLAKVKAMLAEHPNLIYATWDWGGGDFETAIEGAGHVGQTDIAEYLISQGARSNIFVLTMLGRTTIVKAMLDTYPALLNARGPHGFTLLHHAERGGEPAAELLDLVQSRGLTEKKISLY